MIELRKRSMPISEPGLYEMPAADYHADPCLFPSLNSGTARRLCDGTPAHAFAAHPRLTPMESPDATPEMQMGSVVHELLLGKGGGFAVLDVKDFRSKAAQQAREEAINSGLTPIKAELFERAQRTAEHVRAKLAQVEGCETALTDGASEVVAIWQEPTGVWCRGMFDRLSTGLDVVYDIKSTNRILGDHALANKIVRDGLDIQPAFYLRGLWTICPEMASRTKWRWIFVETEEPHEIRVVEADATTLALGGRKCVYAIDRWRTCLQSGEWPGYPRTISRLTYPAWAENEWMAHEIGLGDAGLGLAWADDTPAPELADKGLVYGG